MTDGGRIFYEIFSILRKVSVVCMERILLAFVRMPNEIVSSRRLSLLTIMVIKVIDDNRMTHR